MVTVSKPTALGTPLPPVLRQGFSLRLLFLAVVEPLEVVALVSDMVVTNNDVWVGPVTSTPLPPLLLLLLGRGSIIVNVESVIAVVQVMADVDEGDPGLECCWC